MLALALAFALFLFAFISAFFLGGISLLVYYLLCNSKFCYNAIWNLTNYSNMRVCIIYINLETINIVRTIQGICIYITIKTRVKYSYLFLGQIVVNISKLLDIFVEIFDFDSALWKWLISLLVQFCTCNKIAFDHLI